MDEAGLRRAARDRLIDFVVVYGGGTNAASAGEYVVIEPSNNEVGSPGDPNTVGVNYIPNVTAVLCGSNGTSTSGGYLGTNAARFSHYAPVNVQHRSHQKIRPAQAPGLAVQPSVVPVFYDCGNSTFDQTNRLMKFERDFQLGTDIGPGWTAPVTGTVTAFLEAVDVMENASPTSIRAT